VFPLPELLICRKDRERTAIGVEESISIASINSIGSRYDYES
jgi:hypothetical protein